MTAFSHFVFIFDAIIGIDWIECTMPLPVFEIPRVPNIIQKYSTLLQIIVAFVQFVDSNELFIKWKTVPIYLRSYARTHNLSPSHSFRCYLTIWCWIQMCSGNLHFSSAYNFVTIHSGNRFESHFAFVLLSVGQRTCPFFSISLHGKCLPFFLLGKNFLYRNIYMPENQGNVKMMKRKRMNTNIKNLHWNVN